MRDITSLDVNEIEGSGRLGLDRNLGPLQHDFNHYKRCMIKRVYIGGVFDHFGAL